MTGAFICFQCYRAKTPKQRLLEKPQKGKVKKNSKKPSEAKRGNHLTPNSSSSINYNPWSRRYVGEGGRIPIVNRRQESLTGTNVSVKAQLCLYDLYCVFECEDAKLDRNCIYFLVNIVG